jgi:hypothetical protein
VNRPHPLPLGASLLAAAVVALTVPGVAHAGSNIVIAPKSGQKLTHSPVKVSVRAGWKVRELRVWLNGESVSEEFRRADIGKRNRRTVRLSASHGLRYGRNVVRVSRKRFMRKRRSHRVRFILTRDRPLVGAGRDRRVEVGRSIRLNGYHSRGRNAARAGGAHRSARPGSPAGLRMRWRLVRKPTGSRAKICCPARGVQPPAKKLARLQAPVPQPARPWLKNVDKPGRYVAELVVVDRGVRSVADRVVTTALVGTPLVPVDTMAFVEARPGIAIGYHPGDTQVGPQGPDQRFFPLGQGHRLQLVVLDRRTLETIESWSGPASDQSIATLTAKLKQYQDNRLAIVSAWNDFDEWRSVAGGHPTDALVNTPGQGVNVIGASSLSSSEVSVVGLESRPPGELTWIGVPGFAPGEAWEGMWRCTWCGPGGPSLFTGLQDPSLFTGLQGFLSPDSNDNYAYVGTSPTTFDLGRDGQSVSMRIGPMTFSGALPEGQGGFLVAYQLGTTLGPAPVGPSVQNGKTVYATRNADGSPNYSEMKRMTDDLNQVGSIGYPLVVAIRSIGPAPLARMGLQPPDYQGSFDQAYADALNNLASAIRNVGGTMQLIYGMATTPTGADSYSLVGSNASSIKGVPLEGSGADLGSQLKPQGQARLAGTLSRAKQSHYVPKVAANADVGGALAELAVAEPTEWPHSSTPGEQAALKCIGNARRLGPDPRVAYWLQTYSDTTWLQIKQDIQQMQPAACADVDTTDFTTVRDQLVTEIEWLIQVHSYIDALTTPFTSDGLSSFAELTTITQQVVGEVSAVQGKQVGIDGIAIFADLLDLAAAFEIPEGGAFYAATIGGAFDLLDDLTAESDEGPTIDWGQRVRAGSAKVGEELAGELKRIADGNEKLADIIAADYAKLSTVGRLGQCTPGAPGCTPEWQFTKPQQNAASRMYEITAKREIWAGVLAGGYPFVLETSSNPDSYKGQFLGAQEQINSIRCRFYPPFNVLEPVFLRYGIRQVANTHFLVFAQNNDQLPFGADLDGQDRYHPSPSLLNPLFAPRDPGGDPNKGGLGLDQYGFMIDNWQPPHVAGGGPTRVGWVGCS